MHKIEMLRKRLKSIFEDIEDVEKRHKDIRFWPFLLWNFLSMEAGFNCSLLISDKYHLFWGDLFPCNSINPVQPYGNTFYQEE